MSRTVTIDLGDDTPYPPQLAVGDVDAIRVWIGKNTTVDCVVGFHYDDNDLLGGCSGTCAQGSEVVDERPCICHCHAEQAVPRG